MNESPTDTPRTETVHTCTSCGTQKPKKDFYDSKSKKRGVGSWCKDCCKEHARKTRPIYRGRALAKQQAWRAANKDKMINYTKIYHKKDPLKYRARCAIQQEIKMGRVKRGACEVCGNIKTDAHHDDYTKPLDVRWLCRRHHMEHHTQQRAISKQ